jgi:hypothetical protein
MKILYAYLFTCCIGIPIYNYTHPEPKRKPAGELGFIPHCVCEDCPPVNCCPIVYGERFTLYPEN